MAGYQCAYHDGKAEAVHIHQTIGLPGVIATCDDCHPIYLTVALAEALQVDRMALSDAIAAFLDAQASPTAGQPAGAGAGGQPLPQGAHPAVILSGRKVTAWSWCVCKVNLGHDQDGYPVDADVIGRLVEAVCDECGGPVRATKTTITKALGAHQYECPAVRARADKAAGIIAETCPYCDETIRGTAADIDSGLRKHIEYCDAAIAAQEKEEAGS